MRIDGAVVEVEVQRDSLEQSDTLQAAGHFRIGGKTIGGEYQGGLADVRVYSGPMRGAALARWDPLAERAANAEEISARAFVAEEDAAYKKKADQTAAAIRRVQDLRNKPTTSMVMGDNPTKKRRVTYMLNRGQYDQPIKEQPVEANVPSMLPPLADDEPVNRLGLARWLFHEDHPLTARVAVNKIWMLLIGRGLTATPRDFGAQGAVPSHPLLLDWLAGDFRDHGWNVKRLVRRIVMSRTYRQASAISTQRRDADPENQWLARASRFRLQAELVRDNALAASGLLRTDLRGGEGVKPYQPPGLWAEVGLGGNPKFRQDHGDKLHRRSIYTYWKRSAPPPNMMLFDAPTRETCVVQRPRTNTPLQALVLMNDTQFVEAARALAERMVSKQLSPEQTARYGFRRVAAREPDAVELDVLLRVYGDARARWEQDGKAAEALLAVGEHPRDKETSVVELAAWTVVGNVLLNLDETITRE